MCVRVLPSANSAVGVGTSCRIGGRIPESSNVNCFSKICLNLSYFLLIAYKLTDLFSVWQKSNSCLLFVTLMIQRSGQMMK